MKNETLTVWSIPRHLIPGVVELIKLDSVKAIAENDYEQARDNLYILENIEENYRREFGVELNAMDPDETEGVDNG